MKPSNRVTAFAAVTLTLAACTPEQLRTYSELTGHDLSAAEKTTLLALPDSPMSVGSKHVLPDGSVVDSPQTIVNSLTYNWGEPDSAMQAFRLVAAARGWSAAQVTSWETAVFDIMKSESGFCPNLLGGARLASKKGCVISTQGRRSDAGFGQLISLNYTLGPNGAGWLCREEGLCSRWDVIATPWTSMTALVALLERSGVNGWCYNATARSLHSTACKNPGLPV